VAICPCSDLMDMLRRLINCRIIIIIIIILIDYLQADADADADHAFRLFRQLCCTTYSIAIGSC